jgi:hypothetical protein
MSLVLKPPAPLSFDRSLPSVFLAGSIDMGAADDWQRRFEEALADARGVVLNPRRDAWEPTWQQSIEDANLREQVEWELAAQEMATAIVMYFSPTTKAPITLLELGLFARTGKVVVCCAEGFWRKGNVEITCKRYGVPMVPTLEDLMREARLRMA